MPFSTHIVAQVKNNLPRWQQDNQAHDWQLRDENGANNCHVIHVPSQKFPVAKEKKKKWSLPFFGNKASESTCHYTYYAINYDEYLGKGAFGKVYRAYQIDTKNQSIDQKKLFAVKLFEPTNNRATDEIAQEANDEANNVRGFFVEKPVTINNRTYLFMEYIPGCEINPLDPRFRALSFADRVNGLLQLAQQLNVAHHNKPSTGRALVHADIKNANIKIDFGEENTNSNNKKEQDQPSNRKKTRKGIRVTLLDYGIAQQVSDDPNMLIEQNARGTPLYMAPESVDGFFGVKTDVFLLSIMMLIFFGVIDPLALRRAAPIHKRLDLSTLTNIELDFTGLFERIAIPSFIYDVKPLIETFLRRATSLLVGTRPDCDEVLRFYTTLNNLCLLQENRPQAYNEQYSYLAKLALLAEGIWNSEIGEENIQTFDRDFTKEKKGKHEVVETTWTKFSFEDNLEVCKAILLLHANKLLAQESAFLLTQPHAPQAIMRLHSENLLDGNSLARLIAKPDYCEKMVNSPSCQIAYLSLLDPAQRQSYFQGLKQKEQLKVYSNLLQNKVQYMAMFKSDFFTLRDNLAAVLTEKIIKYRDRKATLSPDKYERTRFGYTNGEKQTAADLLINVFSKKTTINTFFSDAHKAERKALQEWRSNLKGLSGTLVEWLEETHRRSPSL